MSNKVYSVTVKGNEKRYMFHVILDDRHIEGYRADGLVIDEVVNIIPEWVPCWGVKPWCFIQDVFNFKNPWSKN